MGKLIDAQALAAGPKDRRVCYLHEPPCSSDAKVTFPRPGPSWTVSTEYPKQGPVSIAEHRRTTSCRRHLVAVQRG